MSPQRYDVAVVGSGFAGTILARVLCRLGRRVVLIEKGSHPRFAIGESTTPLANFALERLAARYGLPDLHHLSTWGRWTAHLSHLRRGLKRGFTFYGHRRGEPFRNSSSNEARLLVAASPTDAVADTHWLRADVDNFLVQLAAAEGVDYLDRTTLDGVELGSRVILSGSRHGQRLRIVATSIVDAGGPAGILASSGVTLPTAARVPAVRSALLFSHFRGLGSFVDAARAAGADMDAGPYPDEKAAVHHLLDGGWMYVLPFDDGTASCGLVMRDCTEDEWIRLSPDASWKQRLASYPTLAATFRDARPVRPLRFIGRLQYRAARAAGENWFVLPHGFAFYDPLFSTGMAWSLLAVERLAALFEGDHGDAASYESLLVREADRIEQLVDAAYHSLEDFELFTALAHLYFVTVSFTELRQRLTGGADVPFAWEGFLGVGDPLLDPLFHDVHRQLTGTALRGAKRAAFLGELYERLAPRNVAGLADPARHNLYPVDLDVLVERAGLLGLGREEILAALPRLRGDAEGGIAIS